MKMWVFAKRCAREILRDGINLAFGLGFPLVLLGLMSAIEANIPVSLFKIEALAPGIAVFSLSFLSLFSAGLVSRDRESAFLQRLYTTPLTGSDFILGYMLPLLPMALAQAAVSFAFALLLGLDLSVNIIYAVLGVLPMAVFHVAFGLMCGSVLGVRQVGGVCGALLTNLSGWLSGVWFDMELVGGWFGKLAALLPFVHAVEMEKAVLAGDFKAAVPHGLPVLLYALAASAAAVLLFLAQRRRV